MGERDQSHKLFLEGKNQALSILFVFIILILLSELFLALWGKVNLDGR